MFILISKIVFTGKSIFICLFVKIICLPGKTIDSNNQCYLYGLYVVGTGVPACTKVDMRDARHYKINPFIS